eukprot:Stramenopile-MAST_4_protein_5692
MHCLTLSRVNSKQAQHDGSYSHSAFVAPNFFGFAAHCFDEPGPFVNPFQCPHGSVGVSHLHEGFAFPFLTGRPFGEAFSVLGCMSARKGMHGALPGLHNITSPPSRTLASPTSPGAGQGVKGAYVADIDGWLTKYAGSGESWFYRPSFDIHDMQLSPPTTLMKNLLKLNITLHPCRKRGESTEEPWAHGLWNDRTNRESFAYACPSHRIETTDLTYHDQSTNATVDWKYLAQQFGLDDVDFWPLYFQKNQPDMVYISKGNHDIRNGVALFNEDASVFNFFETTLTLLGLIRRHYSGPIIWRHNFWWSDPRYNTSRYRTVVEKIIKRYPGVVVLDGYRMTEHGCGGEG